MKEAKKNKAITMAQAIANTSTGKGISIRPPVHKKLTTTSIPVVVQRVKVIQESNDGRRVVSITGEEYTMYGKNFCKDGYWYEFLRRENDSYIYDGVAISEDDVRNLFPVNPKSEEFGDLEFPRDVSELFPDDDPLYESTWGKLKPIHLESSGLSIHHPHFKLEQENNKLNYHELTNDKLEPLTGDNQLVQIYRKHIRTWEGYRNMEKVTREIPLGFGWVPDEIFENSPSRARYNMDENRIEFAKSLEGNEGEIIKCMRFELMNANSRKDFMAAHDQYDNEMEIASKTKSQHSFKNTKEPDPEKKARAKFVIAYERIEYKNAILMEKIHNDNGKKSQFHAKFIGGKAAPWASFALYLKEQCELGHYIDTDPDVQKKDWPGWTLLTPEDFEPKDQLKKDPD